MAEAVYLLCAATSVLCALLLLRAYRANRTRLLFWSGLCFAGLALNNILLWIDLAMIPATVDLAVLRNATALASLIILLYGLIREDT
jgi:hypothetical protein